MPVPRESEGTPPGAVSCPICGWEYTRGLIRQPASPHLDFEAVFEILQCLRCGGAFVKNPPLQNQLERIYDVHFFSTSQQVAPIDAAGRFTPEARLWPVYRNSVRRVARLRSRVGCGRLLDIGCGKGFFMKAASEYFEVTGTDISRSAVDFGRRELGLEIIRGDFLSVSLPEGYFDVVTMWDVLAGFRDPRLCVERIRELLVPGGLLILTVPDIESRCFRFTRRFWPLLIPPINLTYYSRRSMAALAQRVGLEFQDWLHEGKWISVNFVLRKLGRLAGIVALDHPRARIPGLRMVYLNLRDIATVHLKRPLKEKNA